MIDEFHLINLSICKFPAKFHRNLDTLLYVGFVSQRREFTLYLQPHLLRLLIDLTANGIDLDIVATDGLVVFVDSIQHHLDGVGIESATER